MKAFKWCEDLSVGIDEIDQDHRQLITCLDNLFTACSAGQGPVVLKDILARLMQYTREHFSHEEDVMRRVDYPDFDEHREMHIELVSALDDIIEEFTISNNHELSNKTLQFLEDWLTHHILIEDKKIGKYICAID